MKENVPSMLVVSSLLYKIIPINSNKGIYMIAYSDNKGADKLNSEIDNKPYFETLLAKSINVPTIKIDKIKHYYWKEGTHYFKPYKCNALCEFNQCIAIRTFAFNWLDPRSGCLPPQNGQRPTCSTKAVPPILQKFRSTTTTGSSCTARKTTATCRPASSARTRETCTPSWTAPTCGCFCRMRPR